MLAWRERTPLWPAHVAGHDKCRCDEPPLHCITTAFAHVLTAEIDALPGQEWQRVIYRTLATYGAYYYDSLGSYGINWAVEYVLSFF